MIELSVKFLLNQPTLEVKMSQENGQVFVPDLTSVEVTSTEEVWTVMQTGASGRATGWLVGNTDVHSTCLRIN